MPEEASQIASRMNQDEATLKDKLEALADKGLIFRIRRGGKTLFNAVPFMIGLYEYSVQKMDAALAELYKEYYEQAFSEEMAASDVPGFKVIPIGHTMSRRDGPYPVCQA